MRLLPNTFFILSVHYNKTGEFSTAFYSVKRGKNHINKIQRIISEVSINDVKAGNFVLMYLTGTGVVSKIVCAENEEYINTIKTDDENFSYSQTESLNNTLISFVRKSQLNNLLSFLDDHKILVIKEYYEALKEPPGNCEIRNIYEYFIKEWNVTFFNVLRPGKINSIIAFNLYKRLRIFVLTIILLFLIINSTIFKNISEEHEIIVTRLQTEKNRVERNNKNDKEINLLVSEFEKNMPLKFSIVCDIIASRLPIQSSLNSLFLQKIKANLENGKNPVVMDNIIQVHGSCSDPENVSEYIDLLEKENFAKEIAILSLRQEKLKRDFNFLIEIKI